MGQFKFKPKRKLEVEEKKIEITPFVTEQLKGLIQQRQQIQTAEQAIVNTALSMGGIDPKQPHGDIKITEEDGKTYLIVPPAPGPRIAAPVDPPANAPATE